MKKRLYRKKQYAGTGTGPNGEEILVFQLPNGRYTYAVIGDAKASWAFTSRSWLEAMAHYHTVREPAVQFYQTSYVEDNRPTALDVPAKSVTHPNAYS